MTVKLLCKERSIGLTEWINPIKLPQFSEDSYDPSYMNQTSKFIEFVVESSYCSLVVASRKRICIIKDFPHKLLRNSEEFESALENICMHSNVSVIFIVTDDSHVSTNIEKNLFGDAVKAKFNIGTISFNACAASLLKGAMKRALKVIQTNLDVFQMVSDDVIEAICNASYGDIRCCMNQLYVAALKGSVSAPTIAIKPEPSVKLGAKRKRRTNALTLQNRPKDEVLGLFHCVGRVLNPKFDPVTNRIKQDIEIIMDEFSTQPSVFLNFLHENYIKHFGDVGDAAEAAEALSLAQTYMENWVGRHETITTGVYVAVITLMLNNKHKINAFTPIRGPKKFAALPAKTQVEGMQFASSTDMCYYNSLVKGEKFPRFSFLPQEKE